jgi:hypothetical protein
MFLSLASTTIRSLRHALIDPLRKTMKSQGQNYQRL